MSDVPMVHIGIVTYNSLSDLPDCLRCLHDQSYHALSVTVLDNVSADGTIEWMRSHAPQISLIENDHNAGFGRGHNRIIEKLDIRADDYYLALNPDVRLDRDYLAQMIAGLRAAGAAWGTGKLLLPDGMHFYSIGHALLRSGYAFNIGYGLHASQIRTESREIFGAPGAAMLCSGELIHTLRAQDGELFDGQMFLYGEDVDLDWRARRAGFRCWYVDQAIAYHRGSTPAPALRDEALVNRFSMAIKNACPADLLVYNLPLIVLHCIARLLMTPRRGWRITRQLITRAPRLRQQRRQSDYRRCTLIQHWFAWSAQQPTATPRMLLDRLRAFLSTKQS